MTKLDRLFNDRLANHEIQPSDAAWDKIQTGISKQNSPTRWLRWAAVLIPIILLAGIMLLVKPDVKPTVAQETPRTSPATKQRPAQKDSPPQQMATTTEKVNSKKPLIAKKGKILPPEVVTEEVKDEPPAMVAETAIEIPVVTTTMDEPAATDSKPSTSQKPLVLVYTLASIEPTKLETEEKKPSSLQKVVGFAKTVKHSDPMSEFRIMKEELLAIDLRKKSSKKNQ